MSRQLLDAIRLIQLGLDLKLIERLILQRQLEEVVRAVGWEYLQNVLVETQRQLVPVKEAAWAEALHQAPKAVTVRVRVNLSLGAHAAATPTALAAIQQQDLTRITNLTRESQEAVRQVLRRSISEGRNPRDIARELRSIVGLNHRQAEALRTFRAALEAKAHAEIVAKVAEGQGRVSARPLMEDRAQQIDRAVAQRRQAMVGERAENIARTEVLQALNDAKRVQWQRLVDEGALNADEWEVEWVTADDERTCRVCQPLHGKRAPIGGRFVTLVGFLAGPPAHPRCRCAVRLVPKGFRAGEHPTPVRRDLLRRRAS